MRVPIMPPPGLVSDSTDYAAPGVWSSGSNVRFYHGVPEAIGGETPALQSGIGETYVRASKLFPYKIGSQIYLAVATDEKLWRVVAGGWTRTDITPASGWVLGYNRSFAMFGDILLVVPHVDGSGSGSGTLFESSAGAQATAVANAPDNITAMLVTPSRQVMALGCNEEVSGTFNGRCIRWSDIEDYTDWTTSSANNAGEYILPGQDDIIGARLLGDFIVIWTAGAIWYAQYIGQPGQTFIFTRIDSIGALSHSSHAEFQGTVYWWGTDFHIYAWRPGIVPTRIECPCHVDVMLDIDVAAGNPTAPYRFHVQALREPGEVWFFYTSSASTSPDKYLAYCVNESTQRPVWFRGAMDAGAVLDDPLLTNVGDLYDTTTIRIGYAQVGTAKTLHGIDTKLASATFPSWSIGSSFFYLEEGKRRVQIQRYIADSHGNTAEYRLSLGVRDYPEGSATTKGPFTISPGSTLKSDFRAGGRLISVTFSNSTTPGAFRMGKPVFEAVALGNR